MCGIGGQFRYAGGRVNEIELAAISQHMSRRGPDGDGLWIEETEASVGFVHRRLSIIDVSERASQPMQTPDGRLVVTFNGEIYNYQILRDGLIARGYVFRTTSDTEVLLHLYDAYGPAMVERLRGMFAFAIFERQKRRLMLARDPYGIKPLYYVDSAKGITFASQVKSLLAGGEIAKDVDPAGVVGFYLFGSVPEPFTWCRAIRALPAGTTMIVEANDNPRIMPYCSISHLIAQAEIRSNEAASKGEKPDDELVTETVRRSLADSVRHHLVADVPVGLFLSAGIDSGALLGLMRDATDHEINTVTLYFEEFQGRHDDEAPLAAEIARRYGASHTSRGVSRKEFLEDLSKILDAMDQPTIDGLNTWFVSKAAHELGLKVAISGLGGDELFGGYPAFRDVPRSVSILGRMGIRHDGTSWLAPLIMGAQRLSGEAIDPKIAALLTYGGTYPGAYLVRRGVFMPDELDAILEPEFVAAGLRELQPIALISDLLSDGPRSPFGKVAALEAELYMRNQLLRDSDWASMAHSLEVRVPLVDKILLEETSPALVSGFAQNKGKSLLASAPVQPLPAPVTNRAKTGFSTPIAEWLKSDERSQAWKTIEKLAKPKCRWARRWAYSVWNYAGTGEW